MMEVRRGVHIILLLLTCHAACYDCYLSCLTNEHCARHKQPRRYCAMDRDGHAGVCAKCPSLPSHCRIEHCRSACSTPSIELTSPGDKRSAASDTHHVVTSPRVNHRTYPAVFLAASVLLGIVLLVLCFLYLLHKVCTPASVSVHQPSPASPTNTIHPPEGGRLLRQQDNSAVIRPQNVAVADAAVQSGGHVPAIVHPQPNNAHQNNAPESVHWQRGDQPSAPDSAVIV